MQFSVKLLALAVVSFLAWSTSSMHSDYTACRVAAQDFRDAATSCQADTELNSTHDERQAVLHQKYINYRNAERKWAADLEWLIVHG